MSDSSSPNHSSARRRSTLLDQKRNEKNSHKSTSQQQHSDENGDLANNDNSNNNDANLPESPPQSARKSVRFNEEENKTSHRDEDTTKEHEDEAHSFHSDDEELNEHEQREQELHCFQNQNLVNNTNNNHIHHDDDEIDDESPRMVQSMSDLKLNDNNNNAQNNTEVVDLEPAESFHSDANELNEAIAEDEREEAEQQEEMNKNHILKSESDEVREASTRSENVEIVESTVEELILSRSARNQSDEEQQQRFVDGGNNTLNNSIGVSPSHQQHQRRKEAINGNYKKQSLNENEIEELKMSSSCGNSPGSLGETPLLESERVVFAVNSNDLLPEVMMSIDLSKNNQNGSNNTNNPNNNISSVRRQQEATPRSASYLDLRRATRRRILERSQKLNSDVNDEEQEANFDDDDNNNNMNDKDQDEADDGYLYCNDMITQTSARGSRRNSPTVNYYRNSTAFSSQQLPPLFIHSPGRSPATNNNQGTATTTTTTSPPASSTTMDIYRQVWFGNNQSENNNDSLVRFETVVQKHTCGKCGNVLEIPVQIPVSNNNNNNNNETEKRSSPRSMLMIKNIPKIRTASIVSPTEINKSNNAANILNHQQQDSNQNIKTHKSGSFVNTPREVDIVDGGDKKNNNKARDLEDVYDSPVLLAQHPKEESDGDGDDENDKDEEEEQEPVEPPLHQNDETILANTAMVESLLLQEAQRQRIEQRRLQQRRNEANIITSSQENNNINNENTSANNNNNNNGAKAQPKREAPKISTFDFVSLPTAATQARRNAALKSMAERVNSAHKDLKILDKQKNASGSTLQRQNSKNSLILPPGLASSINNNNNSSNNELQLQNLPKRATSPSPTNNNNINDENNNNNNSVFSPSPSKPLTNFQKAMAAQAQLKLNSVHRKILTGEKPSTSPPLPNAKAGTISNSKLMMLVRTATSTSPYNNNARTSSIANQQQHSGIAKAFVPLKRSHTAPASNNNNSSDKNNDVQSKTVVASASPPSAARATTPKLATTSSSSSPSPAKTKVLELKHGIAASQSGFKSTAPKAEKNCYDCGDAFAPGALFCGGCGRRREWLSSPSGINIQGQRR